MKYRLKLLIPPNKHHVKASCYFVCVKLYARINIFKEHLFVKFRHLGKSLYIKLA